MQFIKTHLISLICGVVSLALLAVAILGMMSTTVPDLLKKRVGEVSSIESLIRDPKTESKIAAEMRRAEEFKREFDKTLDVAKRVNERQPLIPDVFPRPKTDPTTLEFVDEYARAMSRLRGELEAGSLPTASEVEDEQLNIDERKKAEEEAASGSLGELTFVNDQDLGSGTELRNERRTAPRANTGGREERTEAAPGQRRGGPGPRRGGGPRRSQDELRDDPRFRAEITKARSIRMYADTDCFHEIDLTGFATVPPVELLWYAQMSYWVQKDIVAAIKEVNDSAAEEAGGEMFVEQSPIKRLQSVGISGYRLPQGMLKFPTGSSSGGGEGGRSRTPESNSREGSSTFTGKTSDSEFDVVVFRVVLWMDQRRIVQFLDAMKQQNFYECTLMEFQADRQSAEADGYRFGTAPVVRVIFDFEGYYSRALFKQFVPSSVANELGIVAEG